MMVDGEAEFEKAQRLANKATEQAKVHAFLALTAAVLELKDAVLELKPPVDRR